MKMSKLMSLHPLLRHGNFMKKYFILPVVAFIFIHAITAPAQPLQLEIVEPCIELSHITYKEPGLMSERGIMYGFNVFYSLVSDVQWKVEGKLSTGQVAYTGALMDGTPLSISGIGDTMLEVRGLWGLSKPHAPYFQGPFAGLGYRYLYDGADKSEYGYRRESRYKYVPLGYEYVYADESESGWTTGWVIEYDYFLSGSQVSHLSDHNPGVSDMTNEQKEGYGYRASLKFRKSTDRINLTIEPFVRYWNIAQSVMQTVTYYGYPVGYGYEPANNSTEIGVKLILRY